MGCVCVWFACVCVMVGLSCVNFVCVCVVCERMARRWCASAACVCLARGLVHSVHVVGMYVFCMAAGAARCSLHSSPLIGNVNVPLFLSLSLSGALKIAKGSAAWSRLPEGVVRK